MPHDGNEGPMSGRRCFLRCLAVADTLVQGGAAGLAGQELAVWLPRLAMEVASRAGQARTATPCTDSNNPSGVIGRLVGRGRLR